VAQPPATVIAKVLDEAERRDPSHPRRWVALVDGNHHQIHRIKTEAETRGVNVAIVVDLIDVIECFGKDTPLATTTRREAMRPRRSPAWNAWPRGGRALELAIGTGRICLPLSARGVRVDGIDQSTAVIARLRAKPVATPSP